MSYYSDCIKKFNSLPNDIRDKVGGVEANKIINKIENQYNIDLKFLVILVMIKEIDIKDIPFYLKNKYKISKENSVIIKDDLLKKIFSLIVNKSKIKILDPANKIKKIFQEGLMDVLKGDNDIIEELNIKIIYLFSIGNLLIQEELEKILLNNKEKLTTHKFILNKKPHSPTIENWIKDFINQNGSGIFNNLVLTKYITNSENTRNLNKTEKKLVQKLLQLYRNLKFFPESMQSDDPTTWEIIPVSRDVEENITKKQIGIPQTQEEKNIQKLKQEEKKYKSEGLEKLVLEEKIEIEKKIDDLKIEAKKYKDGSLEKMAIEEEINKMRD